VFLQYSAEVNGMLGVGCKSTRPGEVVLPGSLDYARSVLHSIHALPRARSEATKLSSHTTMAPSLLSSSLSRARTCSYSSSIDIDITIAPKGGEYLHRPANNDQHHSKKQAQATVGTD
jgi:hypothetical protein